MSCQACGRNISMSGAKICPICDPDIGAILDGAPKKSPELCDWCFAQHEATHQAAAERCPNCAGTEFDGDTCIQCGVGPRVGG